MTLPVVLHPDPVLRERCAPVERFDGDLAQLAWDMLATMYDAPGRGLAAPQVGRTLRLFVMDCAWKEGTPVPRVFVNPVIEGTSDEMVTREEGCLSIPDTPCLVSRPAWVEVRWQDLSGASHEARFEGMEAVCAQHENDHLDGVLCIDRTAEASDAIEAEHS